MKKKLMAIAVTFAMILAMTPSMVFATEPSGYVTVEITINPEYESTGRDAAARIEKAKEVFAGKQFTTLKEAADAVHKLYSRTQDGNYTSEDGAYTNANPLYYTASGSDPQRPAERFPLSKVVYTVHGTVSSGDSANGINVTGSSDAMYAAVSDIQVVGVDNATITECKGIYASVAGGYDATFVKNGTLLVKGINFTNTTGSTGITANGQANTPGSHADETNTIVEDCSFKNMLYTYLNDRSTTAPNYTIKNCTFDGSEAEKNYAIFIQPDNDNYVQKGKTVITGNTIKNYKRAINIQDRPWATVEISNNTISNITDEGGAAVQITECDTITISNNTIDNIEYNVFRIHELATDVNKITINDNSISNSGYMFYVEKNAVTGDKITFSNNTVSNVDIENGYNKDAENEADKVVKHEVNKEEYGDLFNYEVKFTDADGVVYDTQSVLHGEKATKPTNPTKDGYKFAGWYTDDEFTVAFDFSKEITVATTIYAKWEQNVTPVSPTKPADKTPKTGDTNSLLPWLILLVLAGTVGTGSIIIKRKYND